MTTYDAASPTALLFNITKGSFVDGYGIRTTIFLKGCPLKCKWCGCRRRPRRSPL